MTSFGNQPALVNLDVRPIDYSGPGATGKSRFPLSASLGGVPILVTTSSYAVHTFPSDTRAIEEIYIYASNVSSANLNLTMSFATSSASAFNTNTANFIVTPINSQNGMSLCYPGVPASSRDANNPLKLYVKTSATGSLNVSGYVLRYYPRDNANERTVDRYGFTL